MRDLRLKIVAHGICDSRGQAVGIHYRGTLSVSPSYVYGKIIQYPAEQLMPARPCFFLRSFFPSFFFQAQTPKIRVGSFDQLTGDTRCKLPHGMIEARP